MAKKKNDLDKLVSDIVGKPKDPNKIVEDIVGGKKRKKGFWG